MNNNGGELNYNKYEVYIQILKFNCKVYKIKRFDLMKFYVKL